MQVALNGQLIGQRPLPRSTVLMVPVEGRTEGSGARIRFSDYWTQTAFSGYFKNLALFRRALSLSEVREISSLPPESENLDRNISDKAERMRARTEARGQALAKAEQGAALVAEAAAGPAIYATLVRQSMPTGFWPMDEDDRDGGCANHKYENSKLLVTPAEQVNTVQKSKKVSFDSTDGGMVWSLSCESRHQASILFGESGPMTARGAPGFRSVLFQGGSVRSPDGVLCKWMSEPIDRQGSVQGKRETVPQRGLTTGETGDWRPLAARRAVATPLLDFTFEMWIRRTDPAAAGKGSGPFSGVGDDDKFRMETLISFGSDTRPLPGSAWWRLTSSDGRLDFVIEGDSRPVGPCPSALNGGKELRDFDWHHVAVSRTSSPDEVQILYFESSRFRLHT